MDNADPMRCENPQRISVHMISFINYNYFTETFMHLTVYTYKLNVGISTSNFDRRKVYMSEESREEFG